MMKGLPPSRVPSFSKSHINNNLDSDFGGKCPIPRVNAVIENLVHISQYD